VLDALDHAQPLLCAMRARRAVEDWSDERFWDELRRRLDRQTAEASSPAPRSRNRSRRCAPSWPSRCGSAGLFLAGDAAHIVPPTGAKGLNLAASDVHYLSQALRVLHREVQRRHRRLFGQGAGAGLEGRALLLVDDLAAAPLPRERRLRPAHAARPNSTISSQSEHAMTALAENYVGLPY
jgi:p-hydroxybenzoate 3-monooxygenase